MSPFQHGEVYVTDDGAETDLDLGHYERFTGVSARKSDNVTSGRIYSQVIEKERKGGYLGRTVQVIPHVTDMIKEFVLADTDGLEIFCWWKSAARWAISRDCRFFEAIRQLQDNDLGRGQTAFIHLTPGALYRGGGGAQDQASTQHSVKELRAIGIQPDILLCRTSHPIPDDDRRKIGLFCNLAAERVIPAMDLDTIYRVPLALSRCRRWTPSC